MGIVAITVLEVSEITDTALVKPDTYRRSPNDAIPNAASTGIVAVTVLVATLITETLPVSEGDGSP
jgi:hypothetical protein